jgi:uncharacterized protein (TIGR02646 family)
VIQLAEVPLSQSTMEMLAAYQAHVNAAPSFAERVRLAKERFAATNVRSNVTFREVRQALGSMCSGARRCMYCEDSVADEVEHHRPKTLYPGLTFEWGNLLYACGTCNGPKGNKFAVIVDAQIREVVRRPDSDQSPPPVAPSAMIHPRSEDPLQFLFLDLAGETYRFVPHPEADRIGQDRARYTIDVLSLNKNDFLVAARADAFQSYSSRLWDYSHGRYADAPAQSRNRQRDAILRMHHPTVLREMIRQAQHLPTIEKILAASPEIATWIQ